MKLWITEAIDPSLPHADYLAAPDLDAAEACAARMGNVRIVGQLYTSLPAITPDSLMAFIDSHCVISASWLPTAAEQLGAFLGGQIPK